MTKYLSVDSRKRIPLGALATSENYAAVAGPDGIITLYPGVFISGAPVEPATKEGE